MQVVYVNYGYSSEQAGIASVSYKKGELASLQYEFPLIPNSHVAINIEKRKPFYEGGSVFERELTKSQRARFSVDCRINTNITVLLLIRNVKLQDVQSYMCQMFQGGDLLHTQQRDLHVESQNLSCAFTVNDYHSDTRNSTADLTCSTRLRSENQFMSCYQDKLRELWWIRSVINTTYALQTVSINLSLPVFCCLSYQGRPVSSCNCKDFVWMPSSYPNKNLLSVCQAINVSNLEDTANKSNCSSDSTPTKINCDSNYREFSIVDILTAIFGPLVLGALVLVRSELKEVKKHLSKINENLDDARQNFINSQ